MTYKRVTIYSNPYSAGSETSAYGSTGYSQAVGYEIQAEAVEKVPECRARGLRGATGQAGIPGRNGNPGSPGTIGAEGPPGVDGELGPAGAPGMDGIKGQGKTGAKVKAHFPTDFVMCEILWNLGIARSSRHPGPTR
ncbi:hypothetical protein ANCCEY_01686 [Ancylostoma ceylanicum]|uniref:Collagen triple helix repeat protein n=1 Tax=Ancylostoma ceylanicum TaxID=53326 RepID=A0A0D6M714_9BILA|nr:hypothetical protein ANCCEY_01686 [Ancylostoma ceylanicum]